MIILVLDMNKPCKINKDNDSKSKDLKGIPNNN